MNQLFIPHHLKLVHLLKKSYLKCVIPSAFSQILLDGHRQHRPQSQKAHLLHGLRDLALILSGHKLGIHSGPQQQGEPPPPQEAARYRHQLEEEEKKQVRQTEEDGEEDGDS